MQRNTDVLKLSLMEKGYGVEIKSNNKFQKFIVIKKLFYLQDLLIHQNMII